MFTFKNCTRPVIIGKKVYPCGQCPICRRLKTMEWTARAVHHWEYNKKAIFLTFTYAPKNAHYDKNIKKMNSYDLQTNLSKRDMTLFIKRLRKKLDKQKYGKISYIYCGEYGEKKWRAHYHGIFFNLDIDSFLETREIKSRVKKVAEFKRIMMELWGFGNVDVDERPVSIKAIQYVVGYARKKIGSNEELRKKYEENGRMMPFQRQSKGFGAEWAVANFKNWKEDLKINLGISKIKINVPRYYIKKIKELEGKKITYWRRRIYDLREGHDVEEWVKAYKTIENPEGEMTKCINLARLKQKFEKLEEFLKTEDEEYFDVFERQIICNKEIKELKQGFIYNWMKNKEDFNTPRFRLEKKAYKEIIIEGKPKPKFKPNKNFYIKKLKEICLDVKILESFEKIARAKEHKILNGAFGKREKYEILTEIMEKNGKSA